ncbi:MAG: PASTA domain-containing protein [Eggerthellaceae bacterium]|nr:PASTA domain-containing protein [Eggerthellaceae bacterium]
MYCMHCGAAIGDDSAFCPECGGQVSGQDAGKGAAANGAGAFRQGVSAPAAEAATRNISVPANIASDPQATANYLSGQGLGGKPKQGANRTLIVVGAVALVAVLGTVGLFVASRNGGQGPAVPETGVSAMAVDSTSQDEGAAASALEPDSSSLDGGSSSLAAAPVVVPDLVGMSEADARARLGTLGSFTVEVSSEKSETVEAGAVISQSPDAGSDLAEGDVVHLAVSAGKPEHTYEFVAQAMTWSDAQRYAEERGGTLACVTSAEEWDAVRNVIPGDRNVVFIGGRRDASGNFQWVSGEDFSFNVWRSGEPNNDGGSEDCLCVLRSNGELAWYDTPNDVGSVYKPDKMGFVVEYVH